MGLRCEVRAAVHEGVGLSCVLKEKMDTVRGSATTPRSHQVFMRQAQQGHGQTMPAALTAMSGVKGHVGAR